MRGSGSEGSRLIGHCGAAGAGPIFGRDWGQTIERVLCQVPLSTPAAILKGPMFPRCELCGTNHGPHQAHRFVSASANNLVSKAVPVNVEANVLRARILELEARVAELEAENLALRPKPKVDRKAYMREYMRKRRQK